ncbi:PREDICTED: spermatogenesis-associated serine-rich protein 1 [Nanorana parkeri]|uniref:spermatogenesis-associated serine-rich protein 1 n=1 Tax=Nanorana parkeri TaxID=125878 RepID=UPI0008540394|nr:PREDICTED: spermatogenesis-associated serine-rich protein 1 [Nanorana parkeri]
MPPDPPPPQDDGEVCYSHQYDSHSHPEEEHGKGICLPVIHNAAFTYPNCDLDWKPSVRWLPSPRYSDAPLPHIKDNKFPDRIRLQRSYPRRGLAGGAEWSFYPNFGLPFTYHTGKRCVIDGVHQSSQASSRVQVLPTCLGRKKKVYDLRNGIPEAQPGDKPFYTVEYSLDFHKFGATVPVVNFRESYKVKADTFIPLQRLPKMPCVPYKVRVQKKSVEEELRDVKELNSWKPAQRSFLFDLPIN